MPCLCEDMYQNHSHVHIEKSISNVDGGKKKKRGGGGGVGVDRRLRFPQTHVYKPTSNQELCKSRL